MRIILQTPQEKGVRTDTPTLFFLYNYPLGKK